MSHSGPALLHKKQRPRSSSFSTPTSSSSNLSTLPSSASTLSSISNASLASTTTARSGSALGFRRERTGTGGGLASLVAAEAGLTGGGLAGLGGLGMAQGSREALGREGAWVEVGRGVGPLFKDGGLKGNVEDLNEQVSQHIRRLMSATPTRTLPQVLSLLSADVFNLLSQNCAKILQPKLVFPDTPEGNERLLQRLTEVWSFYWGSVLPYVEGVFLPCRTDERIQRALSRLVQQSQSVTNPAAAQTAAVELEKANAAMVDARKLALMAFRDQIIVPMIQRLTNLFSQIYDSRPGSTRESVHSNGNSTLRGFAMSNASSTNKSPLSSSSTLQPSDTTSLSSKSSSSNQLGAGPQTSAAQAAPAKRLQMVSILSSVMTDDDAQESMEGLLKCMRRWNNSESPSRRGSMIPPTSNGDVNGGSNFLGGKGRGESWESRGGYYTARAASRRGEWPRRRAGREQAASPTSMSPESSLIVASPEEEITQEELIPSPRVEAKELVSAQDSNDQEEEELKDVVPEQTAPVRKGRERSNTMSRRWRSDSNAQRMSYFAELAGLQTDQPMPPKELETPVQGSRRLGASPRLQAVDNVSLRTKGSGASTPTLGASEINLPPVDKLESLKEKRRRGLAGLPASLDIGEAQKKERRNGFVEVKDMV
ncbi:hypothetical protein BT69DRAFT_1279886 [Atractiella rhizophila]|nr:hypothetical protein BT69DRAFT_1279886 [Atractiella rhizophila]